MAMNRYSIPVDTVVVVHATMAVVCVFSAHSFAMEFQIMPRRMYATTYKFWYPRGYNNS